MPEDNASAPPMRRPSPGFRRRPFSSESLDEWTTYKRRRAVPRRELLPLWGQRSGVSRKRGGPGMSPPRYRKATDVVQVGRDPRKYLGAVNTPVFRATTMLFATVADLEDAALGRYAGLSYGLHGLPTVTDFQNAMAALEGGFAALAVPSGLAATTLPFLALAKPGDHVLVTDVVYG